MEHITFRRLKTVFDVVRRRDGHIQITPLWWVLYYRFEQELMVEDIRTMVNYLIEIGCLTCSKAKTASGGYKSFVSIHHERVSFHSFQKKFKESVKRGTKPSYPTKCKNGSKKETISQQFPPIYRTSLQADLSVLEQVYAYVKD
jgi:hypothetical protein